MTDEREVARRQARIEELEELDLEASSRSTTSNALAKRSLSRWQSRSSRVSARTRAPRGIIFSTSLMPLAILLFGPLAETVSIERLLQVTGALVLVLGLLAPLHRLRMAFGEPKRATADSEDVPSLRACVVQRGVHLLFLDHCAGSTTTPHSTGGSSMKLLQQPLLVSAVFILSASSGFALSVNRAGPASQSPRYCTSSSQCDRPNEPDGECCAIQPLDPNMGICAPRNAWPSVPCLD